MPTRKALIIASTLVFMSLLIILSVTFIAAKSPLFGAILFVSICLGLLTYGIATILDDEVL